MVDHGQERVPARAALADRAKVYAIFARLDEKYGIHFTSKSGRVASASVAMITGQHSQNWARGSQVPTRVYARTGPVQGGSAATLLSGELSVDEQLSRITRGASKSIDALKSGLIEARGIRSDKKSRLF